MDFFMGIVWTIFAVLVILAVVPMGIQAIFLTWAVGTGILLAVVSYHFMTNRY